jgi:hypothetical protein
MHISFRFAGNDDEGSTHEQEVCGILHVFRKGKHWPDYM